MPRPVTSARLAHVFLRVEAVLAEQQQARDGQADQVGHEFRRHQPQAGRAANQPQRHRQRAVAHPAFGRAGQQVDAEAGRDEGLQDAGQRALRSSAGEIQNMYGHDEGRQAELQGDHAGFPHVRPRHRGRGEGGEGDRRRDRREDREVEDEHMRRERRHADADEAGATTAAAIA